MFFEVVYVYVLFYLNNEVILNLARLVIERGHFFLFCAMRHGQCTVCRYPYVTFFHSM